MRYVERVKIECESAGFSFAKRVDDGYWEMYDGSTVMMSNRSLGDLLYKVAKDLEINV